jgi:anti-sigma B factor antagonist
MSSFSVREEPDALVIKVVEPTIWSDTRSNSFRDSLYETVQSHEKAKVAFDLGQIDFLNSSGIAILVGLKRRLEARQGKLVLFNLSPVVHDVLRITHLTQYFSFADSEQRALELLRPLPTA